MQNFIHLFAHHVPTLRYQQHLIVEHCLKIIGVAGMPPSDCRAFRYSFCNKICARKLLRYCLNNATLLHVCSNVLECAKTLGGIPATPIILRQCSTIKCCWYWHASTWWINKCIQFRIEIPCRCWENCQQIKGLLFMPHPVVLSWWLQYYDALMVDF